MQIDEAANNDFRALPEPLERRGISVHRQIDSQPHQKEALTLSTQELIEYIAESRFTLERCLNQLSVAPGRAADKP